MASAVVIKSGEALNVACAAISVAAVVGIVAGFLSMWRPAVTVAGVAGIVAGAPVISWCSCCSWWRHSFG